LFRYAGRPAIAESRLSLLPDGRVAYSLKKTWRDGSTHVVMEPQVLIERLLALVPRPRKHLVTYHGVLAPGASLRHRVVPRVDEDGQQDELDEDCAAPEAARSMLSRSARCRHSWCRHSPLPQHDCHPTYRDKAGPSEQNRPTRIDELLNGQRSGRHKVRQPVEHLGDR
jgi:hypothetical protein